MSEENVTTEQEVIENAVEEAVENAQDETNEVEQEVEGEEVEQEVESEESVQEEIKKIKKLMLKVDGQEIEEELPIEIPEEYQEYFAKNLQLSKVAQKRMQETAEMKKMIEEEKNKFLSEKEKWKANPWQVMEEMEIDPDTLIEQRIQEKLAEAELSPEQRELNELRRKIKEKEEREQQLQQEAEQREKMRLQQEAEADITNQINKALETSAFIPKTTDSIAIIADAWFNAIQATGNENLKVEQIVPLVEKNMKKKTIDFLESLDDEMLEEYLGSKVNDRLRKRRLAKQKNTPKTNLEQVKTTTSAPKETTKERISSRNFFKNLRRGNK
jgi:hypothetical protein